MNTKCNQCQGSGTGNMPCYSCNGTGIKAGSKCQYCKGTRFVKCGNCNGKGYR